MKTRYSCFFGILILVLNAALAVAQTSRGTVTGQISDPQGAMITGATIKLFNQATGQTRATSTNHAGIYRFDAVDLGAYDVTISASGFKEYVNKNIGVQANRVVTLDTQLDIGTTQVVMEVNAEAEQLLQTSDVVRGGNFTVQEMIKLPLSGLDVTALARLLPGVTQPTGTDTFGNGGSQTQFAVNGQRPRGNSYLLDGTDNNDISVGGPAHTITNDDVIAEFSAQTGMFSAEFGRAGGGVFNVITRSGGNGFHGTARELFRSQAFNAMTQGQRNSGLTRKPVYTENIYGFTFGGPIIKNKTFFFGSAQWDPYRSSANSSAFTVPTAAGRSRLRQLYPSGANPRVDLYLTAFAGIDGLTNPTNIALGKDPVTSVDRGSVEFGRRGIPYTDSSGDDQFLVRLDHSIGEKHRLAFRYAFDDSASPYSIYGPGFASVFAGRDQNFLATHTLILSPNWTNEFRASYGRIGYLFLLDPNNLPLAKTLPYLSISGISSFGLPTNMPQYRVANNWLAQETMTKVAGTHTVRFGFEFFRQLAAQRPPFNERGSFNFLSGGGYAAFANYIDNWSGYRSSANINFGSAVYYPNLFRQSYFFQDTWKATRALTLTMGLRYENFGQPANNAFQYPAFAGFDPARFLVPNKVNPDNNNLGPVVGITWSPSFRSGILGKLFGQGKTVWRGGYQISYDTWFNNLLSNIKADTPNTIATTNTDTMPGTSSTSRGTPGWYPKALPTVARVPTALDSQTSVFNKNIRNPYTQRFSFGLQRELPLKTVMDLSYVGSLGRKLFLSEDLNPLVGTARMYPDLGIRRYRSSGANSSYNALQVRLDRRFSHGVQMNASYTWSNFMDVTSEVFSTANSNSSLSSVPVFQGGLRLDRAVSDYDRRHRFTLAYIWELPGPKRGILGHVAGGWSMSGVTTFQSGAPYTFANGTDRNGDGQTGPDRPDIGNPRAPHNTRAVLSTTSPTGYINPDTRASVSPSDVFVVQGTGFPGPATIGRNTERSHRVNNFDWSLFKNFRITERFRLEYRLETFNIFNHPQFTGVPNDSVVNTTAGSFLNYDLLNGGGRNMRMGLKLSF